MTRRLVIETAANACAVALFDGDALVAHAAEAVARGHAERLLPLMAGLAPTVVDEVLVDCGPGSFTGLRVGLAAAIALGIGWQVPVHGFSSLALLAALAGEQAEGRDLLVVNEGGHGQVFVQRFTTAPLAAHGEPVSLLPADALPLRGAAAVVGSAAARVFGEDAAPGLLPDPRAAMRLPVQLRTLPPAPIYCRAADARPMA